ncbi:branched-chain amino acid ABC transporter permease [Pararhodobacter zhoushanensis]|uniref:Branched-chain amino acid ABC transporter permease n=1 Tax=Pararhodobacter zhoushanensis TaxID=2479545 RepID=A0ABT3GTC7_9RHOB|nr:branched-chain amino acid ABC transporter permease [Pararhodobacter zhoushanensis]MCW1930796.1 branched-chain amino acid ABC transporter permease [Pararhodobacter zhoushanensis]
MRFDYHTRYRQGFALLRHPSDWLAYGLLAVVLLALPLFASTYLIGELGYVLILCIAAMGLMALTGFTGQVSLGHASFVAIGAYAHAWLLAQGVPFVLALPLAGVISAGAGLVVGIPAIRVSGLYLAMVTLAFSIVVEQVIGLWRGVTGGFMGMLVETPRILGVSVGAPKYFYYVCLFIAVLVLLALANLMRSGIGRAFTGVRDSEAAAYALGIEVKRVKVGAFGLSAGITGLAGALMAHHIGYLTPDAFTLLLSLDLVLMVVIGGMGSLRGAILGAVLISFLPKGVALLKSALPDAMARQSGLEIFVAGLVLALFVLFEPMGLNGRWLKLRALFESFPLYRRDTFRRQKTYMKSERSR